MKNKLFLLLVSCLLFGSTFGQSSDELKDIDSLILEAGDQLKVDAQEAVRLASVAADKAYTLGDSTRYYRALLEKAKGRTFIGETNEALKVNKSAITYFEKIKDTMNLAYAYSYLGSSYLKVSDFLEGIKAMIKANELLEKLGKDYLLAKNFGNIGVVYYFQNQHERAIEYYRKALVAHKKIDNTSGIGSMYNNIGVCYDLMNKQDSALIYYEEALKIRRQLNEHKGVADLLSNIGIIYKNRGDYEKALDYYKESIKIKKDLKDVWGLGISYENMGSLNMRLKKPQEALKNYKKAESYYTEAQSWDDLVLVYKNFAETYAYIGNYRKAFDYMRMHQLLDDSLNNVAIAEKISELETRYESEKKDREISLLKKDQALKELEIKNNHLEINKKKAEERILLLVVGLSVLIIIFFIYGYRQKQKANLALTNKNELINEQKRELEQTNEEISAQRDQINLQKELLEERNTEITDSILYAKYIQNAILENTDAWQNIGVERMILYKPRDIVSGDFYWAYTDENVWVWAAADCTGHGVPGAFMSMLSISFLHQIIAEDKIFEPGEVLNLLRDKIIGALEQKYGDQEQKDGLDIALCTYYVKEDKLRFCGANNPLYRIRREEAEIFKGNKMPVGKYLGGEETPFEGEEIPFQKGDLLVTFSDGYIDQFGGDKDKKYGSKRFRKFLLEHNNLDLENLKNQLDQELTTWIGDGKQLDDICVVGVRA